jgi:hypothetical protein
MLKSSKPKIVTSITAMHRRLTHREFYLIENEEISLSSFLGGKKNMQKIRVENDAENSSKEDAEIQFHHPPKILT